MGRKSSIQAKLILAGKDKDKWEEAKTVGDDIFIPNGEFCFFCRKPAYFKCDNHLKFCCHSLFKGCGKQVCFEHTKTYLTNRTFGSVSNWCCFDCRPDFEDGLENMLWYNLRLTISVVCFILTLGVVVVLILVIPTKNN